MSVLVAGGAGYIGSITAQALAKEGREVIVYDNLARGHSEAVPEGATFVEGDLANHKKVDSVMHFAAHSQVGESMENPSIYFQNNVSTALGILDCMLDCGVGYIVFSSTCAIFGEPEIGPITEDLPKNPASPYGESKLMFERILWWYHKIHGLNYAALRYFNACGASGGLGEDHSPETHLIPVVLQVALGQREAITVFGNDYPTPDGTCVRDYIHVEDLARAHILVLEQKSQTATEYNIGNGAGYSVLEVIEAARRITGHPIPTKVGPRRPGDPPRLVGSSAKVRAELGWNPKFPEIGSIVESAWKWHKDHPKGYRSHG